MVLAQVTVRARPLSPAINCTRQCRKRANNSRAETVPALLACTRATSHCPTLKHPFTAGNVLIPKERCHLQHVAGLVAPFVASRDEANGVAQQSVRSSAPGPAPETWRHASSSSSNAYARPHASSYSQCSSSLLVQG